MYSENSWRVVDTICAIILSRGPSRVDRQMFPATEAALFPLRSPRTGPKVRNQPLKAMGVSNHSLQWKVFGTASLLAVGFLGGCASPSESVTAKSDAAAPVVTAPIDQALQVSDASIKQELEDKLRSEAGLSADDIKVEVDHNVVTLRGKFRSVDQANRAIEIADSVRGVLSVDNLARVEPPARPDQDIQSDVARALRSDPATQDLKLNVKVDHQTVTLSGEVDDWQAKDLAGWVAGNVRGVWGVNNQIRIVIPSISDDDLAARVQRRLKADPLTDDEIEVSADHGVVTLRGRVDSAYERNMAVNGAWSAGARRVNAGDLAVRPENAERRKVAQPDVSDAKLQQSIADALSSELRLKQFHPTVAVKSGAVTLSGTVSNLKAKQTATQITEGIRGVRTVNNTIQVKTREPKTDAEIAQSIRDAFRRSPMVDPDDVKVTVVNGAVQLSGAAESQFERWRAEDIAARTEGVVRVEDLTTVRGSNQQVAAAHRFYYPSIYSREPRVSPGNNLQTSDGAIAAAIRNENFWNPLVPGENITVNVSNGVATLTGEVRNDLERHLAEENAYRGGAWKVIDKLKTAPDASGMATAE